jgi:hypothetical protein
VTRTEVINARDDLRDAEIVLLRAIRDGDAKARLLAEAVYLAAHAKVYGQSKVYAPTTKLPVPSPPPTIPNRVKGQPTRRVR